ncbi:MAG: hypothetical protein NTW28_37770 [Candidatus Solibacter sp.]|nr:hypothetical protein [Candidatus Solibacter sp.]
MALFTDGAVASIEELRGHDTQLLNVATVEGIDVTRKLALAQEELSVEVAGLLGRLNAPPAIHQVVVTTTLKLWHVFRTLEMVYRDAYNSQLNDRYAGKRDEYREMVKWAYDQLVRGGLGIAADPVEQARTPEPRPSAGGLAEGAYYVAIAWTNAAGEEGGSSVPAVIRVSGSSFAVETTVSPNVKGWNVYCGTSPATMTMQNLATLAPGQTWVQPDTLSSTGRPAGSGQAPTYRLALPRTIQRG